MLTEKVQLTDTYARGLRQDGSRILGLGAAQPDESTQIGAIGERFGRTAEWIQARTGIQSLRRLRADEQLIELAVTAGAAAMNAAGLDCDEIDLIIATCCSSRTGSEQLGPQLGRHLAPNAGWLDLNAACSGFCYAVSTADALIRNGSSRHVLIVAAEHMSSLIDPADLGTSIIFGDGAGAAVVGPCDADGPGVGPVAWGSDGTGRSLIAFGDDDTDRYMRMQGQPVFRWAVETVPQVAIDACKLAGVTPSQIDVFVPHQANLRIIDAITRKIGLDHAVVATDITGSGNTSSASIPIALSRLVDTGAAKTGQLALLAGFGAGLAYAAQVVRVP